MAEKTVIVAAPELRLRNRLEQVVGRSSAFRVIECTGDLMTTYTSVEERLPNAVLIAEALANLPEFEVMRGLFATLDIRWLVVTAPNRLCPGVDGTPPGSDLFAVTADAGENVILQQLDSLTRTATARQTPAARQERAPLQEATPEPTARARQPRSDRMSKPERACAQAPDHAAGRRQTNVSSSGNTGAAQPSMRRGDPQLPIVLIGSSTGGVDALLSILSCFPPDCPPTMIVQHTGAGFGTSLAGLLNRQCKAQVRLADGCRPVTRGEVVIGAGINAHLVLDKSGGLRTRLLEGPPVSGHLPSVDMLFRSATRLGDRVTAVLLTGMGRDGADGMLALRQAGAHTIAQDRASAVVWGMPRAAKENGAAQQILPLDQIGPALVSAKRLDSVRRRELNR